MICKDSQGVEYNYHNVTYTGVYYYCTQCCVIFKHAEEQ